jgi:hypothetical protein
MAKSVLDRVRAEIRDRLNESRAAVEEYERLQAAEAALRGVAPESGDTGSNGARATRKDKPRARRAVKAATGSSAGARAPRGANRAAVLRVLEERPGVSVAELSSAAGVARPVLYNLLSALERKGEISREELAGGVRGYRLSSAIPGSSAPSMRPFRAQLTASRRHV